MVWGKGRCAAAAVVCGVLAGCASSPPPGPAPAPVESIEIPAAPAADPGPRGGQGPAVQDVPQKSAAAPRREREARAKIEFLLPERVVREREAWVDDIAAAFVALELPASPENLCAAIAVIEQESGFVADPVVPGLSRMAWKEIEQRRQRYAIPKLALDAALARKSGDGRTYKRRIDALRTEREMSELFEEMIDELPGGRLMLSGFNPVRTGGPMQVSISFAELHARGKPYRGVGRGGVREAVFTRRGGVHFGIAHLLDYPATYSSHLYRFADFNAGHYASRNAAFQLAVARLSGHELVPDGDLLRYEGGEPSELPSATQKAVLSLSRRLKLDHYEIRAALRDEKREAFARSALYRRVFELADRAAGRPVAREALPRIRLKSPKITRKLTTAWFAERVNTRYGDCLARRG